MGTEKIIVEDMKSLAKTLMEHGGGKSLPTDVPSNMKGESGFICRIECNDGSLIDFYAPNAQLAAQFPPEIIEDSIRILEKSINDFVQIIGDPEPFVSIIKGHAYIEALLTSILTVAFFEPLELEIDRIPFSRKVNLCVAAGLIHGDVARVLKEFAKIRNSFAHQLWPAFTEKELRDFVNVLRQSEHLREELTASKSKQLEVFDCVWPLWIYLFQQACRITTKRKLLSEFWHDVVDADEIPLRYITAFRSKPLSLSDFEEGK